MISSYSARRLPEAAFTLIEMLVVIAIISVLAAMLAPSLQKTLRQAQGIACLSNLKQINMGMQMYTGSYNGEFPYYIISRPSGGTANHINGFNMGGWPQYLYDSETSTEVFYCPCDTLKGQRPQQPSDNVYYYVSYAYRYCLGYAAEDKWQRSLKLTDFKYPSRQVMMYERNDWHGEGIGIWNSPSGMGEGFVRLNGLYADSHAKVWHMSRWSSSNMHYDPNWFLVYNSQPDGYWNPKSGSDE